MSRPTRPLGSTEDRERPAPGGDHARDRLGVYLAEDPGGVDKSAKQGQFRLPLGDIFEKGLTIGTGQTPVKKYNAYLRDLIIAGRAKPSFIVSHRLTLEEAPAAYEKFDRRSDGYTKVILKPEVASVS